MKRPAHEIMIDARTIYAQWKNGHTFSVIRFREVLNYFEAKFTIQQTLDVSNNLFSKMKLLHSLMNAD